MEGSLPAWEQMDEATARKVEQAFAKRFRFEPTKNYRFAEPSLSVTYDVSAAWPDGKACDEALEVDLNVKCLNAFRLCLAPGERLAALDWYHPAYWFRPAAEFNGSDRLAWKVPILPDGDFYIFFTEDYRLGLLGHMFEESVCVWGDLVALIERDPPRLFAREIRRVGVQRPSSE